MSAPTPPPRISVFGNTVVAEISDQFKVDKKVVIRACLVVALLHQDELTEAIEELRGREDEL